MKAGLVGPSYQLKSLPFNAQRTVNLYPVMDETGTGKEVSALYPVPGAYWAGDFDAGASRGVFAASDLNLYWVCGERVYRQLGTNYTGSETGGLVGTIGTFGGPITWADNGLQLGICDGANLYVITYSTGVMVSVASVDVDFPGAATVDFMDGYFVYNKPNSGKFYISGAYDGTTVNALDFATAENSPDGLVRVVKAAGLLWLLGEVTTETWYNSGDVTFPFTRTEGAVMDMGCASAHSVQVIDNTLIWVGQDRKGAMIVYRANGITPQRISTAMIEEKLFRLDMNQRNQIKSYAYQYEGHLFYVLWHNLLETSFVYDVSTGLWHERAYMNEWGNYEPDRFSCVAYFEGRYLAGDRENTAYYLLQVPPNEFWYLQTNITEAIANNGKAIKRERTFTHIHNENKPGKVSELQVDFEYGIGLTSGQGSDPVAYLEVSKDYGKTWSQKYPATLGKIGEYGARCVWRRLGWGVAFTFRVTTSEPIPIRICGAYIK